MLRARAASGQTDAGSPAATEPGVLRGGDFSAGGAVAQRNARCAQSGLSSPLLGPDTLIQEGPWVRRGTAVHSSEPCRSGKVGAAMGERAAVEIKRSGAAANLRRISRQAKTRVTEVTWLPAPELQHFRAFPTAIGVTRAPG